MEQKKTEARPQQVPCEFSTANSGLFCDCPTTRFIGKANYVGGVTCQKIDDTCAESIYAKQVVEDQKGIFTIIDSMMKTMEDIAKCDEILDTKTRTLIFMRDAYTVSKLAITLGTLALNNYFPEGPVKDFMMNPLVEKAEAVPERIKKLMIDVQKNLTNIE